VRSQLARPYWARPKTLVLARRQILGPSTKSVLILSVDSVFQLPPFQLPPFQLALITKMEPSGEAESLEAHSGRSPHNGLPHPAFQSTLCDFHMSFEEPDRALQRVTMLRAMAEEPGCAFELRRELYKACATKARGWAERWTQRIVAEFHLCWQEESDLLRVNALLCEGLSLVATASAELGDLSVCLEMLAACEAQLRARLAIHIRRANRHELRTIFTDFCERPGRESLQALCLEKYCEQVDKHVQSEAIHTRLRLQALISSSETTVHGVRGGSARAELLADKDVAPLTTVKILSDYLECVAVLGEELGAEGLVSGTLPVAFVASVLREVEHEACVQVHELISQVRTLSALQQTLNQPRPQP